MLLLIPHRCQLRGVLNFILTHFPDSSKGLTFRAELREWLSKVRRSKLTRRPSLCSVGLNSTTSAKTSLGGTTIRSVAPAQEQLLPKTPPPSTFASHGMSHRLDANGFFTFNNNNHRGVNFDFSGFDYSDSSNVLHPRRLDCNRDLFSPTLQSR